MNTPRLSGNRTHVYHLYILLVKHRDALKEKLKEKGIASEVYYPQPLHLAAPCRELGWVEGSLPVSEQASRETLALPLYAEMTEAQINKVVTAIIENAG